VPERLVEFVRRFQTHGSKITALKRAADIFSFPQFNDKTQNKKASPKRSFFKEGRLSRF
jgi:hypothetical protein